MNFVLVHPPTHQASGDKPQLQLQIQLHPQLQLELDTAQPQLLVLDYDVLADKNGAQTELGSSFYTTQQPNI